MKVWRLSKNSSGDVEKSPKKSAMKSDVLRSKKTGISKCLKWFQPEKYFKNKNLSLNKEKTIIINLIYFYFNLTSKKIFYSI